MAAPAHPSSPDNSDRESAAPPADTSSTSAASTHTLGRSSVDSDNGAATPNAQAAENAVSGNSVQMDAFLAQNPFDDGQPLHGRLAVLPQSPPALAPSLERRIEEYENRMQNRMDDITNGRLN